MMLCNILLEDRENCVNCTVLTFSEIVQHFINTVITTLSDVDNVSLRFIKYNTTFIKAKNRQIQKHYSLSEAAMWDDGQANIEIKLAYNSVISLMY